MKKSQRQIGIEARQASDPIAQAVGREDIDYTDPDQLPTAPRNFLFEKIEAMSDEERHARGIETVEVSDPATFESLAPKTLRADEPDHDLVWSEHLRNGGNHTEWHAPCGCAFHPKPFPHVHPCSDEHKRPDLHGGDQNENT